MVRSILTSVPAMLPRPRPKAKSNAAMTTGKNASWPLLAADRFRERVGANHLLDQLVPHAHQHEVHRELGQAPRQAQQQALAEKHRFCAPSRLARGGPMSGANKPASASGTTANSPSAPNARASQRHPAPPASVACAQTVTSIISATPSIPTPNPSSCSMSQSCAPVHFCSHAKFHF